MRALRRLLIKLTRIHARTLVFVQSPEIAMQVAAAMEAKDRPIRAYHAHLIHDERIKMLEDFMNVRVTRREIGFIKHLVGIDTFWVRRSH